MQAGWWMCRQQCWSRYRSRRVLRTCLHYCHLSFPASQALLMHVGAVATGSSTGSKQATVGAQEPPLAAAGTTALAMSPCQPWLLCCAHPVGRIMNSCMARPLPACSPPLMTLKEGTGSACWCMHNGLDISGAASTAIHTIDWHQPLLVSSQLLAREHEHTTPASTLTSFLLPASSAMYLYRGRPFSAAPACITEVHGRKTDERQHGCT